MQANCNFYILPDAREDGRFIFCCSLLEKLYSLGHSVYVYCQNEQEANRLNELLWTYKDISFIPHSLSGKLSLLESPIQIGFSEPPAAFQDILIFFAATLEHPSFCRSFHRIVEIVNQDPTIKETLRLRYQHYRAEGYMIKSHPIR